MAALECGNSTTIYVFENHTVGCFVFFMLRVPIIPLWDTAAGTRWILLRCNKGRCIWANGYPAPELEQHVWVTLGWL